MVPFQAEREGKARSRDLRLRGSVCACSVGIMCRLFVVVVNFQAFSSPGPLSVGQENIALQICSVPGPVKNCRTKLPLCLKTYREKQIRVVGNA